MRTRHSSVHLSLVLVGLAGTLVMCGRHESTSDKREPARGTSSRALSASLSTCATGWWAPPSWKCKSICSHLGANGAQVPTECSKADCEIWPVNALLPGGKTRRRMLVVSQASRSFSDLAPALEGAWAAGDSGLAVSFAGAKLPQTATTAACQADTLKLRGATYKRLPGDLVAALAANGPAASQKY